MAREKSRQARREKFSTRDEFVAALNSGRKSFFDCDFSGLDLSNLNLQELKFKRSKFNNANLLGTNFGGAWLNRADFTGATFDQFTNFQNTRRHETKFDPGKQPKAA